MSAVAVLAPETAPAATAAAPAKGRYCKWDCSQEAARQMIEYGLAAPLWVYVPDETPRRYFVGPLKAEDGRIVAWTVTNEHPDGSGCHSYLIDVSFGSDPATEGECQCEGWLWSQRKARKMRCAPKPCRHMAMVSAALKKIGLL